MKKLLHNFTIFAFCLLSITTQTVYAQQCSYSGQETTAPVWPTITPTCSQQQLNAGQGNGSYRYYYIGSALNNSFIDIYLQNQCGSLACARVNGHQGGCCDNTGYFNCNNTWATFQGAATSDYILVTTQQGGAWCTSPNGGSAILYYKWSTPGTPALSGATTVCASTNSTYSFLATANTTSYSWGTPTTISGTATATLSSGGGNSTSATYSFSGSGVVRLSATSSNNGRCTSTGTIDVTVNAISTAPTSITASQGYTTACGGQAVTLSVNGGSLGFGAAWRWYSGSCGGTLVASGVSSITVAPTSTTTYFVRAEGTCNNTTCASYTLTYQNPQGDPTVFGDNVWRAYAFRDQNFKDYGGFYTDTRLSFDVSSRWNTSSAPSSANASNGTAYSGCSISDDYHSVVYKRKGFPCGRYRLDIPNYDDDTYLFVNGVQVWSNATGCCAAVTNAWTGYLDANSTVEYRWREGVGASDAGLTFNLLSSSLNFGTPVVNCDASNTGCITVTPSGGTPPYLINIGSNFRVNSGKYRDITITSSTALTNYQVQISVPFYSGAKSDFSDYRFYDVNGNLIPYWRESFTASSSAIFWVKVPSIANGTTIIRLTYGNTDVNLNTTSSPHETFELFDDFNSANNSYDGLGGDWITGTTNAASGTIFSTNSTGTTISTGRLSGGNQNRFLRSRKSFVGNFSVETRTLETSPATNGYTTNGFYLNATTGISFLSHNGTGFVRTDNAWPNPGGYLANVFVREAIKCVGTSANVSRIRQDNNTSILNVNYTVGSLNGHFVRLGARGDDGNYDQNFSATWDWIFVRKSTTTEPSISIGVEQSSNQFCGLTNNSTQSVTVRDNVGCTVTQNVVIPALPSVPSVDGITTTVNVNKCGGSTIPLTPGSGANTCRVYNGIPPTAGGSGTLIASGSSYAFTSSQTVYITSYNSTTGCESAGGIGVGYVQVNITVSPSFTFTVSTTQPSCNGGSNGTASATLGTPGTSPYTFNWSGGNAGGASFGVARTGFTAGNYQVTVNDNAGCQAVQTFTISEPSVVQIANATLSNYNGFNVSCNGSNNGSIALTVSGGTGGYTYTWSPNVSTSANANSLSAGTYNVTVRDANLCSATASYTLSQPNLLAPSVAIGYGCGGATYTNSTIVVTPAGGVPNYTYQFSGGTISGNQTTVTSNGLYGYTVTDANNCSVSGSANVTQIGQPVSANDACNAIYVSSSGVSSASGTKSCPTTLVNALTLLSASRNKILIEGTTFNISQKLVIPVIGGNPAITIEGGYNVSGTTWIKTSNQKTILNITSAEENPANNIAHRIGISAVGVSNFTLQDLTVNVTGYSSNSYVNGTNTSASQGFGKSVYGIYINNCSNYNIVRCAVTVGNATAGSPGSPGSAGANGGNGGNGQTANDGCVGLYYAPGGSSSCSSGGTGGANSNCSFYPAAGSPGAGGACGGGAGSDNCNNTACSNPGAGGRGCDGVDGADQGQAAAGSSGSISSGFWLPGSQGATGANGGNGTGGGGGGGGGASFGGLCFSRSGGSGGGGGGAGCGGTGGTGGFGGGSAYAIFTNGNSGTNNVIDCSLTTGSAGAGGIGGGGGSGGSRGFGGIGGASVNCETARGGDGGNGGRGGNGGQGGNGQAGEAVTLKIVSGSVSQSGTSVPNASDPVTVDADQGCTNSIITVTKSLSAGNFNIPSGASIVNDLNSSTPSTTVAGPTMYVTFASGQTGKKDLVAGSTTYRNYYDIRYDRTPPTMSISNLNPCRNTPITLTCTNDGSNPSGNPVTYEWQIISGVTPSNPSSGIVNAQSTTHTFAAVGTYQVRLRVKVSCCGWSAPIYQTINVQDVPANATSITQGIPVACQNQNGVTYTVGAVSGATSYNWTVTGGTIAAGQGTSQITVNWGGGTSGTVSVRPANSCGNSPAPYSINVTLNGNPTASINPTPVTADFCAGGSVTLQGGATSGGGAGNGTFSYEWSTSQLIQTISVNSANTYFLTVTEGGSGCKGITSINVTQLSSPSITTHPANSGVCEQTNTSFTVAATGAGLTYQWQVSTDGGGTWNNITTAGSNPTYSGFNSSATLNLNGVVNANNGWRYRVIVSGTCSPSVTSNAAILTVNPAPTISQSPQASTICNGGNTSFTVTASGFGSLSYQWQVNDGGGWANITAPGSNPTYGGYNSSNTLTLTGAPTAVNGYNYRVVVSGGCAPSATSSPASLTVNPTSVGGTAGTTGNGPTICTGGTTTLLLGGNTGSVQWQDSPDGTNWTNIPGATSTLYNTPVLTADRYYRAIVTSGVCPSATSTVQLISVKNSIAGTASSDQTICTGSQPANISLTGFNGAIQWQQADDAAFTTGLINIPGGTNSTLTGALIGVLTSTKYFRAQVTDFPCGTVSSNTVTVTVSPLTVSGNVTGGNSPICEGGNTGVMTLSGNTGSVVKWQKRVNSGAWTDIANTALTYSEVPTSSGTWDYRAVVQSGACAAANSTFTTIVVNAAPAITILPQGNDTIGCNNDIFVLNTSISGGGGGAISYQWAEFDYGNNSYTNIGGATNATYTTMPLVNLDNTNDAFYKYRVTYNRAGSGCPSASDDVEIKIFPTPSLTSTMDECASTVISGGNDKWDYIFTVGSAATPNWVVTDYTGGAELVYQAPNNNGEGFKIYRIPMGSGSHNFQITDDNGCTAISTLGRNSTLPTLLPNTVMPGNALGQCYLTGFNEWVHFKKQGSNSEVIASIKDNGVNLGIVTVESYREATAPQIPNSGPTCIGTPVAAMRRHYRITSNLYANPADKFVDGNGSPTNIELQLYFSQSDFNDLVSSASGNNINGNQCTEDDDITQLNSLYLTKYSDYDQLGNEDGDYMNNSTNSAYYRVFNVGNVSNPLVIQPNGFDNIFGTNGSGYHYAALSITEFSEFWLHGSNNGSPLPVEMLFIEAKNINNNYIQINWATATELNNWKFEVERSTDGVNFTKIGEVIGNGTSTDRHDYTYNDKNVTAGIRYYYRLKQIDFDESYEYSPVVSEMLRGDDLFKVSDFVPNPAADQAKLIITTGKEQEVQIEMHNYLGEIVKKGTTYLNKGSNTINFDFADLAAGTYTTRVVAGTNTHVRRVVITR